MDQLVAEQNYDFENLLFLQTLERIFEIYDVLGSGSSLSKKSRWNLLELFIDELQVLRSLHLLLDRFSLSIHVREEFGFWSQREIIPLEHSVEFVAKKKKQNQTHKRGVQRLDKSKCRRSFEDHFV